MKLRDCIKMAGAALLLAAITWGTFGFIHHATTPKPVPVVQVKQHYARIAAVYEGNIDWRFYVTTKMLAAMAPQFVGKPLLLGHNWINPNVCIGRVVDAAVKEDKFGHYVEVIVLLNSDEAAAMIKRDAYHAVSIGFETIKEICMIDNKDPEDCGHEPGHRYKINGALVVARSVLAEVRIHELSFVNVPASTHARVLELADHLLICSISK